MEDFNVLIHKLQNKIPFAFAHFNDGEMTYILGYSKGQISRGYQDYNEDLQSELKETFLINNKEFYRGIPCSICFYNMREGAIKLLKDNNTVCTTTNATLFHNSFVTTNKLLCESLKNYTITWVINNTHNLDKICNETGLDRTKSKYIIVPSQNAYGVKIDTTFDTEMVIFLCGPLGRILTGKCFEKNPNKTFLCLGSYFDYINGTLYDYYVNNSFCRECCFQYKYF